MLLTQQHPFSRKGVRMSNKKQEANGVVGYLRYSCHAQDDGFSIESQQAGIEAKAKSLGLTVTKYFVDRAKTGRNRNRPGYQELKQEIEAGNVKVLFIHDIDRLHRKALNTLEDYCKLEKNDIRIIDVKTGIDTAQGYSKLLLAVKAVLAEEFSDNLKKEVRKSMVYCAKQGRYLGGNVPMGYKVNGSTKKSL